MGVYDLEYIYDQGGNRTRKIDHLNDFEIVHTYDTSDPGRFNSANNRLMHVDRVEPIGGTIVERTFYFYNAFGSVTRIVTNAIGTDVYSSTWLIYGRNGSVVVRRIGAPSTSAIAPSMPPSAPPLTGANVG